MNDLEIKNLTKKFKLSKKQQKTNKTTNPYLTALKNFSLSLKEGEIFGLLGPNGAGKTTALRIISSLIKADEGSVLLNNEDIYKDISGYRKKVGFLTSELKLDGFFTPDYTFTYMSSHFVTILKLLSLMSQQMGLILLQLKMLKIIY